jgi:GST-like protein
MELYTAGTGNGQRAAIAVNECGVSCKIHVLNLAQGDQKKPDYLKINPTARIPTLIDPDGPGGKPLTLIQSWAILMYLCEKTGKFLPADPVGRARMFQWLAEGAAYAPTRHGLDLRRVTLSKLVLLDEGARRRSPVRA